MLFVSLVEASARPLARRHGWR